MKKSLEKGTLGHRVSEDWGQLTVWRAGETEPERTPSAEHYREAEKSRQDAPVIAPNKTEARASEAGD